MKTSQLFWLYVKFIAWELMNFGFGCLQLVYWLLNGTYWQIRDSRRPANYKNSAHVSKLFLYDYLHSLILFKFVDADRKETGEEEERQVPRCTGAHRIFFAN